MSDRAVPSGGDTNGKNGRNKQALEAYQSAWMAHWAQARCSASPGICAHNVSETEELHFAAKRDDLANGLQVSTNLKLFGYVVTRTFEIVDERVEMSSKGTETEKMQSSAFEYDPLRHVKQPNSSVNASFSMTNTSGQGWFPVMSKCSDTELFPTSEKTETKKPYNDCDSPHKLQNCAHDVGKTGIRTSVDSVGGTQGVSRKSPQITHILSKQNDIFTSGSVFKGNTSGFPGQGKPSTAIDSEAKENQGKVDAFKEKNLNSGASSSSTTSTKHSLREDGCPSGKRTKLNSPNSSDQRAKSLDLGKSSFHEETKRSSDKMLKSRIASSKPEQDYSKNDEDSNNQGKRPVLSNAWIQRLLHKKPDSLTACELQSSKLEDLETEQLPSIAAMALMGKAMTGFASCDIQNKGSFSIWNTKAF